MSEAKQMNGDNVYAVNRWPDTKWKVDCRRELGEWTVRIGGHYVQGFKPKFPFYSEDKPAREAAELAIRLRDILGRP